MQYVKYEYYENSKYQLLIKTDKITLRESSFCTGTMVSMFGQKSHGLSGVLLYAAYLTKGHKLNDYPVPVMTLSGDLDGLTRITRVMLTFK